MAALPTVCKIPPQKFDQMRPGDIRDFAPGNFSCGCCGAGRRQYSANIFDTMRIDVDFPAVLRGEPFDLFDDAEFGAVAAVQKRRDDGETQFKPSWETGSGLEPGLLPAPLAAEPTTMASGKEYRA